MGCAQSSQLPEAKPLQQAPHHPVAQQSSPQQSLPKKQPKIASMPKVSSAPPTEQQRLPVIIIGAGISGLAASLTLKQNGIEHIIIEGRDRFGGRINFTTLQGFQLGLGASYVHLANQDNTILQFMKENNLQTQSAGMDSQIFYHEGIGEVKEDVVQQAQQIYQKLNKFIQSQIENSDNDMSVQQAARPFLSKIQGSQQVKNIVNWLINDAGSNDAAEIREISAAIYNDDQNEDEDVLPAGGWHKIIEKIYSLCTPNIIFNQKVIKIDYSQDYVKIHTTNNVYQAQKIISSLPLGVLKAKTVSFVPPLPLGHQAAIDKLGFGVMNKIFLNFEKPFWDTSSVWLNFVTKQWNKYPGAISIVKDNKYIMCIFTSGDASKAVSGMSDTQIINDVLNFFKRFNFKQEIKLKSFFITRWDKDPFSLGSYSFLKIGSTRKDIENLSQAIDEKLWFIGEHCHPQHNSYAHTAYETGISAAEEVAKILNNEQ